MHADVYLDDSMIYIDAGPGLTMLSVFSADGNKSTVMLRQDQAQVISQLLIGNAPDHEKKFVNEDYNSDLIEYYFLPPKYPEEDPLG